MEGVLQYLLTNLFLACYVLGFLLALLALCIRRGRREGRSGEAVLFLRCYLFCPISLAFLGNFIGHVFFSESMARTIGWAESPFQSDVGWTSLGFALIGLMGIPGGPGLRAAAVLGPACFSLGSGASQLVQIIGEQHHPAGHPGSMLYMDFIIPFTGMVLLALTWRDDGLWADRD